MLDVSHIYIPEDLKIEACPRIYIKLFQVFFMFENGDNLRKHDYYSKHEKSGKLQKPVTKVCIFWRENNDFRDVLLFKF